MTDRPTGADVQDLRGVVSLTERTALARLQPVGDPAYLGPSRALAAHGAAVQCALALLHSALRGSSSFLERACQRGTLSIVVCPGAEWKPDIVRALEAVIAFQAREDRRGTGVPPRDGHPVLGDDDDHMRPVVYERTMAKEVDIRDVRSAIVSGRPAIVVLEHMDSQLALDVRIGAVQTLVIGGADGYVLRNLAFTLSNLSRSGRPIPQTLPRRLPQGMEGRARHLTPALADLACVPGQGARDYLIRLDALLRKREAALSPSGDRAALNLGSMAGMGEAAEWGRQLVHDLGLYRDGRLGWRDIDRGAVLVGDPGTGKTTFARAMARSAGVPLIATSLARWHGARDGHLGHLLSAMHASFSEARQRAPCILLIDEIDAFPSRADVRHAHRDYVVQVVDALLEHLDGAVPRDGVVVIGTCNDASGLDPALLRPGRLESVIRVPRPDAISLGLIMRHHLGRDLADADLAPLAWAAADAAAVGADVERWCRAARRAARTAGRAVYLEDLEVQIPPARMPDTPEERRRVCVHEAGHALAWSLSGFDVLMSVQIGRQVGSAGYNELDTRRLFGSSIVRPQAMLQIRALLAGRAAEIEILGQASGGAGGSARSDLAQATRLGLLVVASLGLDEHEEALVYRGGLDTPEGIGALIVDPDIRGRVADLLRRCHDDAQSLVRSHRDAVERLASTLAEREVLDSDEVREVLGLGDDGPHPSRPDQPCIAGGADTLASVVRP